MIIASKNSGKIHEIKSILSLQEVEILDLRVLSLDNHIEETGKTFTENALIKAEVVYKRFRLPVIADDSGLVVPHLSGEPGVFSARYAGPQATDRQNNTLLLTRLKGTREGERTAWFCCVAVFYHAPDTYHITEGRVKGTIAHTSVGTHGFGYDPIFYVPKFGRTMAQLSGEEKNSISHRGKAFRELKSFIDAFLVS